ncbi:phosphoenolpyruvate carboxykinase [alpha proteobacterium BAL199]|jgi:16S rRNA (guanine527-N7)-methyltransferase|nr:phosphoenolpyruvate carboxykinase [alpha proteobacterium BAL199]
MNQADVQAALGFDDAIGDRLAAYVALLVKWQARINLVAPASLPDVWSRHVLDSGQLARHMDGKPGPVLDLGSGAGFPGLVLAILGRGDITLVEADRRKVAFLQEAARVTDTNVAIECCRIEALRPIRAGIVTARALASVSELLHYARPYVDKSTVYLFLKGERVDVELTTAQEHWNMRIDKAPSLSDSRGVVLRLEGVTDV